MPELIDLTRNLHELATTYDGPPVKFLVNTDYIVQLDRERLVLSSEQGAAGVIERDGTVVTVARSGDYTIISHHITYRKHRNLERAEPYVTTHPDDDLRRFTIPITYTALKAILQGDTSYGVKVVHDTGPFYRLEVTGHVEELCRRYLGLGKPVNAVEMDCYRKERPTLLLRIASEENRRLMLQPPIPMAFYGLKDGPMRVLFEETGYVHANGGWSSGCVNFADFNRAYQCEDEEELLGLIAYQRVNSSISRQRCLKRYQVLCRAPFLRDMGMSIVEVQQLVKQG